MLNMDYLLMVSASFLLLFVDFLAFHDITEARTVRDWLMLVASIIVFVQFARVFWRRNFGGR